MRISRIQLAGLAVALAGGATGEAAADDLVISNATTAPVATSSAANASAGNVSINAGGSITVTAGQTAITVDSNNNVTNLGSILSTDASTTTGIRLTNGFAGNVTGSGVITLTEDHTLTDTDADGNLDGAYAVGFDRNGILLDAGVFTGNINTSGAITIEGNNSAAMRLNGMLGGNGTTTGNLTSLGGIFITGDNSSGFIIDGGTAGDVIIRGAMSVRGENSTGLEVNGAIGGELRVNGSWVVTGFHNTLGGSSVTGLDPDDLLLSGAAIAVHASVAGGITVEGIGLEDDPDDNGDGVTETAGDTADDASAAIRTFGTAPAILIQADASNIALGATSAVVPGVLIPNGGFGFQNRGSIFTDSVYEGFSATGLRIEGTGGFSVTTADGIVNDQGISATAREANAYAVYIGANATAPNVINRNLISAVALDETAAVADAYALYFGIGATVGRVYNSGIIRAQSFGEIGDAIGISDQSGTVTRVTNSGTILAQLVPTDADPSDDVLPPTPAGNAIAIDLRNAAGNVIVEQVADTPFGDDDAVDDDAANRPAIGITGDILLGGGADLVDLQTGTVIGDMSFGNGADTLQISGGAVYRGILSDGDNNLSLNISNGTLDVLGGNVGITNATFGATSTLGVTLSGNPMDPAVIVASGTVTFASGAHLIPHVPAGLPTNTLPQIFLTANGGLFGAIGNPNILGTIAGAGTPYVYNLNVSLTAPAALDGAPNSLQATYALKSATQLGLNTYQSAAFLPVIDALRLDSAAANAFASLDNSADFFDAYEDLLPSFSSAAAEVATTAIQQAQSATTNRLTSTRLHDLNDVSVWAQEIGYSLTRNPATANGQEFTGNGFGLATGIDGPLENGGIFGLSAAFVASEVTEPGRPEGEISASFGQLNAYLGTAMGPIDLDFVAGAGVGKMQSRRFVEIGDTFNAVTQADWWSYEGHGAVRASMPMRMADWLIVSPQAALTYVALSEQSYEEGGGGAAIDYSADSAFSQRLWGDVGLEFSARLRMRGETVVAPRIFAGYRANLIDEAAERSFQFVSGGSEFTLTDESLGSGGPLLGIGLDATNGYSTFSLSYEGEFGDQIERHSLNASVRFRF